VSPEEFILRLIQKNPDRVLQAVRDHRLELTRPPKTVDEYFVMLEKQGLPKTVTFLRKHETNIWNTKNTTTNTIPMEHLIELVQARIAGGEFADDLSAAIERLRKELQEMMYDFQKEQ